MFLEYEIINFDKRYADFLAKGSFAIGSLKFL